jgi:HD-like signal output (HDOD) protein/CheY-like chemotaxis protein
MPSSKKKIMFVDDEPNVLSGLRRLLNAQKDQWEMTFVGSGAEALARLEQAPFDVLVTDMRMPEMDGAQLLEQVRVRYSNVARIILSGQSDKEIVLQAVGLAHQFLAKPCEAEMLKLVISRACALREILENDRLKSIFSRVQSVPSIPAIYMKMVRELQSPEASIQRVGQIITEDPGMTAKVLQLVNSAFFGIPRQITCPSQAVNLLGLETIKALSLIIHIFEKYEGRRLVGIEMDEIWDHVMRVGVLARQIVKAIDGGSRMMDDAFVGGVLHDIGKLILAANLGREYEAAIELSIAKGIGQCDAELITIGATHASIGGFLLGLWGLPDSLIEAIVFHHHPRLCPTPGFSALTAVHVANVLEEIDRHQRNELLHRDDPEALARLLPAETLDYLHSLGLQQHIPGWIQLCFNLPVQAPVVEEVDHE